MFANSNFANALEKYRWLMALWTLATIFVLASQLLIASAAVLGTVFFLLGAAAITTAGVSCAYVIARDSMQDH